MSFKPQTRLLFLEESLQTFQVLPSLTSTVLIFCCFSLSSMRSLHNVFWWYSYPPTPSLPKQLCVVRPTLSVTQFVLLKYSWIFGLLLGWSQPTRAHKDSWLSLSQHLPTAPQLVVFMSAFLAVCWSSSGDSLHRSTASYHNCCDCIWAIGLLCLENCFLMATHHSWLL